MYIISSWLSDVSWCYLMLCAYTYDQCLYIYIYISIVWHDSHLIPFHKWYHTETPIYNHIYIYQVGYIYIYISHDISSLYAWFPQKRAISSRHVVQVQVVLFEVRNAKAMMAGSSGDDIWLGALEDQLFWYRTFSYWKWPFIVDLPIKNGDFP